MTRGRRVSVLIADDHPIWLRGLAQTVRERPDLELLAEAPDGRAALETIARLSPAVAVLDVQMPGLDGPELMAAIRTRDLPTRVLFVSASVEPAVVYDVLAMGASGYLSKLEPPERVCDAVAAVARGESVLPAELHGGLLAQIRSREARGRPQLTEREHEVLRLIAEGLSAPAIAERLFLSPATVRTHLQNLYEKLGVSDRAAAVAEAMRQRLLD